MEKWRELFEMQMRRGQQDNLSPSPSAVVEKQKEIDNRLDVLEKQGKMLVEQNQDTSAKLDRILNVVMQLQTQNR